MLSVHEVTTAYQGLVALSAVSIEVAKGEIVCVAGANGAGKSTLIKSIAGAERPRSGSVTFDGARIDGLSQHMITARGIAYVPKTAGCFRVSPCGTICGSAVTSIAASPTARRRLPWCSNCFRGCPNGWSSAPKR